MAFGEPPNHGFLGECRETVPSEHRPDRFAAYFETDSNDAADGTRDSTTIENLLADSDDVAAPVLKKLLARSTLTKAERLIFSHFMALQMFRVPTQRGAYEQIAGALGQFSLGGMAQGGAFDDMPEVKKMVEAGNIAFQPKPEVSLRALDVAKDMAPAFNAMYWGVLRASGATRSCRATTPLSTSTPRRNNPEESGHSSSPISFNAPQRQTVLAQHTSAPFSSCTAVLTSDTAVMYTILESRSPGGGSSGARTATRETRSGDHRCMVSHARAT